MYIVSTPYSLFLWYGSQIEAQRKSGALYILKSFIQTHLHELLDY